MLNFSGGGDWKGRGGGGGTFKGELEPMSRRQHDVRKEEERTLGFCMVATCLGTYRWDIRILYLSMQT